MSLPVLTVRVRALWEGLAGVPAEFAPEPSVVVSPRSALGPPGWVDLVVIDGSAIVTAPDTPAARMVQQALGAVPVSSLTDPGVLSGRLVLAEVLGPAALAYLDPADFRPASGPAEALGLWDPAVGLFLSEAEAADLAESGLDEVTSPVFALREGDRIVAAAGYRDWPGRVAHLSVLTARDCRGRGLGGGVASAAVAHALGQDRLPQWRARVPASRRIARRLGFRELGFQLCLRLRDE
jgi:RimJ/RimL family protein N-acetyltransferase